MMVLRAGRQAKPWYSSSQIMVYLAGMTLSMSVVIEMVDPLGQGNVAYPYKLFVLLH